MEEPSRIEIQPAGTGGNKPEKPQKDSKKGIAWWRWALLVVAILYDISPIDLIPDIPVVGWIDDFGLTAYALLNLWQGSLEDTNRHLATIVKYIKLGVLLIVALLVIIILLGGLLVFKAFGE